MERGTENVVQLGSSSPDTRDIFSVHSSVIGSFKSLDIDFGISKKFSVNLSEIFFCGYFSCFVILSSFLKY